MSWRTQGQYKGLSAAQLAWVKAFDSAWDQSLSGRSHTDALDRSQRIEPGIPPVPDDNPDSHHPVPLQLIWSVRDQVDRFTVPHSRRRGFCIIITLKSGKKVRANFSDTEQATQAYQLLLEAFSFVSAAYGEK